MGTHHRTSFRLGRAYKCRSYRVRFSKLACLLSINDESLIEATFNEISRGDEVSLQHIFHMRHEADALRFGWDADRPCSVSGGLRQAAGEYHAVAAD